MIPPEESTKVSTLSRVLAWVFVFSGVLVIAASIMQIYWREWPWSRGETILTVLGMLLFYPLVFFVAWKGRPPRWWSAIEKVGTKVLGVQRREKV